MAVILSFLLLGAVIIFFFGELIFTAAALALLSILFVSRLDLSGTWVERVWLFVTAPPISLAAAVLWTCYVAVGALLFWALNARLACPLKEARSPGPTASQAPRIPDLASLERELLEKDPMVALPDAPEAALPS